MKTKKVYPFINAQMCGEGLEDRKNVVFDAREVESYESYQREDDDDIEAEDTIVVNFKSGRSMCLYVELDQELYPGDNLITAIDMVQYSHFWHDNEDSAPDDNEK